MRRKLYRVLLRLYPRRHTDVFGEEMQAILDRRRGFWRECGGLLKGAVRERLRPVPPQPPATDPEARLRQVIALMVYAIANHQFELARACAREERELRERL